MDFCGRVLALSFCYFANFKLKDWHLMCFMFFYMLVKQYDL